MKKERSKEKKARSQTASNHWSPAAASASTVGVNLAIAGSESVALALVNAAADVVDLK